MGTIRHSDLRASLNSKMAGGLRGSRHTGGINHAQPTPPSPPVEVSQKVKVPEQREPLHHEEERKKSHSPAKQQTGGPKEIKRKGFFDDIIRKRTMKTQPYFVPIDDQAPKQDNNGEQANAENPMPLPSSSTSNLLGQLNRWQKIRDQSDTEAVMRVKCNHTVKLLRLTKASAT